MRMLLSAFTVLLVGPLTSDALAEKPCMAQANSYVEAGEAVAVQALDVLADCVMRHTGRTGGAMYSNSDLSPSSEMVPRRRVPIGGETWTILPDSIVDKFLEIEDLELDFGEGTIHVEQDSWNKILDTYDLFKSLEAEAR